MLESHTNIDSSPEHELEQFEDDPLEYVRLDLLSSLGDAVTRRQAAADVLRALVGAGLENETTTLALEWISAGLAQYAANPGAEDAWKAKDSAVYLLTAVAARGGTTQVGSLRSRMFVNGH
jgi:exportin-2 (importin alpha re-exporter)